MKVSDRYKLRLINMKLLRKSKKYNLLGDKKTGVTIRWGKTLSDDPILAPWPELVDISISNHCTKNCSFCYRNSTNNNSFLSAEDYEFILKELNHKEWGNVFQVALGGGEPLEHPDFLKIIDKTLEFGIVPNFTTNGQHLDNKIINSIKGKIGAIAISTNDLNDLDQKMLNNLVKNGIKTNIHFVLDNKTIKQGVEILNGKYDDILKNINSLIFLTYKPAGRGVVDDCLIYDKELINFISLIDKKKFNLKIGFDACFVPLLLHKSNVDTRLIDPCECGFFSVYIDEKLNVKPCSFCNNDLNSFNLREISFKEIWNEKFGIYRKSLKSNCTNKCKNKKNCKRVCPYFDEINLCFKD